MNKDKTIVTISKKEYEEQGTAILKDAVDALKNELDIKNYEIIIRKKSALDLKSIGNDTIAWLNDALQNLRCRNYSNVENNIKQAITVAEQLSD